MREVIYDQEWLKTADNLELYYMYRDVAKNKADQQKIKAAGLRYDITIMPACSLGPEFVKTAGHSHPCVPGHKCTYTEIYEVISGQALYLMQQWGGQKITDVYLVQAKTGDKVIIPPNYGHVTINASGADLVMANWVADCFKSDYTLLRSKKGASFYALSSRRDALQCVSTTTSLRGASHYSLSLSKGISGERRSHPLRVVAGEATIPSHNQIRWQPNTNYGLVPKLRFSQPTNFPELGLAKNKPMYNLITNLSQLDFLKRPQDFNTLWQKILGDRL